MNPGLIALIVLAAIHVFANRAKVLGWIWRGKFLSFASGISLAYVFVDLLPTLEKGGPVLKQTFGTIRAVTESLAGNHDPVDPRLQLAGNRKVIHGGADRNDVGSKELLQVDAALRQVGTERGVLHRAALPGRQVSRRQVQGCIGRQIPVRHLDGGVQRNLSRDDLRRERTACRIRSQNAGIDVKELHDGHWPRWLKPKLNRMVHSQLSYE